MADPTWRPFAGVEAVIRRVLEANPYHPPFLEDRPDTAAAIALKKMAGDAVLNTARLNLAKDQHWLLFCHEAGELIFKEVEPFLTKPDDP